LCSDGLTEELDDEVIAEYCLKVPDLEQLVLELIEAAKERGGRDNITVVIAEYA
jgi:protein phosphatase